MTDVSLRHTAGFPLVSACLLLAGPAFAQTRSDAQPTLEIYGFTEADPIADFKQNDPEWFDTNRPSRLPAFADEFGQDGRFYFSPRHTRFGVKTILPTVAGEVQTTFEFDLVGVGPKAGQTAVPSSPRVGPVEADRRGAHLQPVHGPGRVSEPAGLLGTERHDHHPHATSLLAVVSGRRFQPADRRREPGSDR